MDKNLIKKHLTERFLSEDATPGISMANKMKTQETKVNKDGVKAIEKDMTAYDKDLKKEDKDKSKMAPNKFNYNDGEKEYHDEMEIKNGLEMTQYARKPNKEFKDRAEKAIVGDTTMGNAIGGNAEEVKGVSSDKFGKDFLKTTKASQAKRDKAEISSIELGDDIETTPKSKNSGKQLATETKTNNKTKIKESMKRLKFKNEFKGVGNALKLIPEAYRTDKKEFEMTDGNETYRIRWEGTLTEGRAVILTAANKTMVNEDINRMKALFNYKSESTLGLVKGNARIDENAAFTDVWNKTKKILCEEDDIESVTAPVKDADSVVNVAKEAKKHIEGSVAQKKDGTAPAPKKGTMDSIDSAVSIAPEAKKHIEGSVAQKKDGTAPAAKVVTSPDAGIKVAPEAKKHIASGNVGHKATDTAKVVKEVEEEEEIVKEVEEDEEEIVKENEENPMSKLDTDEDDVEVAEPEAPAVDDEEGEEEEDNFYKPSEDDASAEDKEPTARDIKKEVPPSIGGDEDDAISIPKPVLATLMRSQSSNNYFMVDSKGKQTLVPEKLVGFAIKNRKNPKLVMDKIQDEIDFGSEESGEEEDEF